MLTFNDLTEKELGIVIEEPTSILGRAPMRVESVEIAGRDGSIDSFRGYASVEKQFKVQIVDLTKIDLILSTFVGKVKIQYMDRFTYGTFTSSVDIERWIFLRKTTLSFSRDPFWYREDDYTPDSKNNGNIDTKPMIKIMKKTTNSIDVTIAGIRFKYNFKDGDTHVVIDCKEKKASYNGLSRNRNLEIGWNFPILSPGNNSVKINSGTGDILFKEKDAWL